MSDIRFWRPVYQLFKPDEPLSKPEELRNFYVERDGSPVRSLVSSLELSDVPEKFLLAGHRGGGKTTELRKLQQRFEVDYTVIWVDADTALDRYNVGYAEVIVLIGLKIFETVTQAGWRLPENLQQDLLESLKTVIYQDQGSRSGQIGLPKFFQDAGIALSVGLQRDTTKTLNIRPALTEIISRVNAIIEAAEAEKQQKLLVIVDGLDRRDQGTAKEMFCSPLLTELNCHIIYSIPIAFRYSTEGKAALEIFDKCLDLDNPPVFKCNEQGCPTTQPDKVGRHVLQSVVQKRLAKLGDSYQTLFQPEALTLLCEKSGGVMRELIRLARTACEIALAQKLATISLDIARAAVREERKIYSIRDYHFPVLQTVHRTGQPTSATHEGANGKVVIFDELLQYKLILGYEDPHLGRWFDVNPILFEDLERWQAANSSAT
ncbi:hypothetical protein [Egbenema bharatensis]|uniref:hypothetical protein n=1 Tax=Egbenema bharatensis TaxID=3463334 RepID=UPI003A8859BB